MLCATRQRLGLDNPVGQYGRLLRDWRLSAKNQNGQRPRQGRRIASNQRPHVAAWQDRIQLTVVLRLIWIIHDWCRYVVQDMELITPGVYQCMFLLHILVRTGYGSCCVGGTVEDIRKGEYVDRRGISDDLSNNRIRTNASPRQ